MKRVFILHVIILIASFTASAQNEDTLLIDSGNLLQKGLSAVEQKSYKEAINYYGKITRNDTNYVTALMGLADAYRLDSQFTKSINVCLETLKDAQGEELTIYINLGLAYDGLDNHKQAIESYQKGLIYSPYNYTLWYDLGIEYEHLKDLDGSFACYKKALQYNPFHSGSLYQIGKLELEKGHTVTAMMSFYMSLLSNPSSRYVASDINGLDKISNVKLTVSDGGSSRKSDNFYDIELLIASKIAISGKFKNETKIEDGIINQTQMVIDKLEYIRTDTGFFMQNYVPFFIALRDKKYFPPFIYQSYYGINSEAIQNAYKKNKKTVDAFKIWAYDYWDAKRTKQSIVENGISKTAAFHFYTSNRVKSIGEYDKRDPAKILHVGPWVFFYENGYKQSEGTFNSSGNKEGQWQFYYYEGGLKEISNYKDGNYDGAYEEYATNGQLTSKIQIENNLLQGVIKNYDEVGNLISEKIMKDSKFEGITKEYYRNGKVESETNLKNSLKEGVQTFYYSNGAVKKKLNYKNNLLEGEFFEYYENGSLKRKGAYTLDNKTGVWMRYYENKYVEDSGSYAQGVAVGKWVLYHNNGVVEERLTYDAKGKRQGEVKDYDADGILQSTFVFSDDRMTSYIYYDKKGTVVSSGKEKGGVLIYKGYYADGKTIEAEGTFKNGLQEGEWKYYNRNNYLEFKHNYVKGMLNGLSMYYYSSGTVQIEKNYKNGLADGLYKSYYKNKQLEQKGYYVEDLKQGYWLGYLPNGNKDVDYYYLNDVQYRYNIDYTASGKKFLSEYYEFGYFKQIIQFDTLGKPLNTADFVRGNGVYKSLYPNKTIQSQYTFKNGDIDGPLIRNYQNGKPQEKTTYVAGEHSGSATLYDEDGTVSVKGAYKNGRSEGTWTYYYPNGTIESVGKYNKGQKDSVWVNYAENGKKEDEVTWDNGDYNGPVTFYSPDLANQVIFVRNFVHDNVVSYSYPGKDGKLVPFIPIYNETVEYKAYYPSGTLAIQFSVIKGAREGKLIKYYSAGQKFQEWNYITGEQEGHQFEYYPSGAVKTDDNYLYDEKDGICKAYYTNGTLKSVETYIYGVLNGTSTYYDQTGKATKKVFYRDGIIY